LERLILEEINLFKKENKEPVVDINQEMERLKQI
jgi:hypothetical protein